MANPHPKEGRRFQKGNNANPRGAGAHNPIVKQVRRLTQDQVAEVGSFILNNNKKAIEEIKENPESSFLKHVIASALLKSADRGELATLNALLDRVIGKPKEKFELDATVSSRDLTEDEKLEAFKRAVIFIQNADK